MIPQVRDLNLASILDVIRGLAVYVVQAQGLEIFVHQVHVWTMINISQTPAQLELAIYPEMLFYKVI